MTNNIMWFSVCSFFSEKCVSVARCHLVFRILHLDFGLPLAIAARF